MATIMANEAIFHDRWAKNIDIDDLLVLESFHSPTALENQYILKAIGPLKGKKVLDLGCGAGESSVYFALNGADVVAVDVSAGMLTKVAGLASKWGVSITTVQEPAEQLLIPEGVFDIVYGNGVLHHVNIQVALSEVARALKPNGTAVFIEPLAHNPLINIYRRIATSVRSPDEKPLSYRQIKVFNKYFTYVKHKEFWLTGLTIFVWFYLSGIDPNKDRYWKRVIREGEKMGKAIKVFEALDRYLLRLLFLRPLCWNTVIMAKK